MHVDLPLRFISARESITPSTTSDTIWVIFITRIAYNLAELRNYNRPAFAFFSWLTERYAGIVVLVFENYV